MGMKIGAWCGVAAVTLCVGCAREKIVWSPSDPDWLDQSEVESEISVAFFESSQGTEIAVYDLPAGNTDVDAALNRLMRWAEYHGVPTVSTGGAWSIAFDGERRKLVGFHADEQIVWFHANLPSDDWRDELRGAPLPEIEAAIAMSRTLPANPDPLRLINVDENTVATLGVEWYTFGEVLGGPPGMYTSSVIDGSDRILYSFHRYTHNAVDSLLSGLGLEPEGDWEADVQKLIRTSTGAIAGVQHRAGSGRWTVISRPDGEEITEDQLDRVISFVTRVFGARHDEDQGVDTETVKR